MAEEIGLNSIKLKYVSLEEARSMTGLRLILGAYAVPGPWREACKGIFYVKKISYVPVASAGKDGSDLELREWTAQTSAPVAVWNDERPRSTWLEQLYLAERLEPDPPLIPAGVEDRVQMIGLINEICGETGLAWSGRLRYLHQVLRVKDPGARPTTSDAQQMRALAQQLGEKYGYTPEAAEAAPGKLLEVLRGLSARMEQQRAQG